MDQLLAGEADVQRAQTRCFQHCFCTGASLSIVSGRLRRSGPKHNSHTANSIKSVSVFYSRVHAAQEILVQVPLGTAPPDPELEKLNELSQVSECFTPEFQQQVYTLHAKLRFLRTYASIAIGKHTCHMILLSYGF